MNNELYHYGVVGMKWGVRRARRKEAANERLRKKALDYDIKSSKLTKKSEKIHAEKDLERSNTYAKKAAKLNVKAGKLEKRALKTENGLKESVLTKRAEKLKYKAAKRTIKANQVSKTVGYGTEAMKYSVKSDKVAAKAAKARMKIANNEHYMRMMDRKVSELASKDAQKVANQLANTSDTNKVSKIADKLSSKYKNTSFSEIDIAQTSKNGHKYVAVLMGRDGGSPYDDTTHYKVSADALSKSTNRR